MNKSLYSEFPTNAHALGYGMHKLHLLKEACKAALARDREKVSDVIIACRAKIEAGEKVDQEEGAE